MSKSYWTEKDKKWNPHSPTLLYSEPWSPKEGEEEEEEEKEEEKPLDDHDDDHNKKEVGGGKI